MSIVPVRNQALKAVPGLFGLASNQGPREVDNGPAQPTYDLTRLAELASGRGDIQGYVEGVGEMVHAGAGDLFDTVDVDTLVGVVGQIQTDRAWLINVAIDATPGVADEALGAIVYPASVGTPTVRLYTVAHSLIQAGIPSASAGVDPMIPTLLFNGPWFLPKGTVFRAASNSSGIGTIRVIFLCWVGPLGSRPPGA